MTYCGIASRNNGPTVLNHRVGRQVSALRGIRRAAARQTNGQITGAEGVALRQWCLSLLSAVFHCRNVNGFPRPGIETVQESSPWAFTSPLPHACRMGVRQ